MTNTENADNDLDIRFSTPYELECLLKSSSKTEFKWQRAYSEAIKEVDILSMQLQILTAQIVEELIAGRELPATAKQELRKTTIFLDKRWQQKQKELIFATETMNTLKGLMYSFSNRSKRLEEIARLVHRTLFSNDFGTTVKQEDIEDMNYEGMDTK